MTSEHDPQPGKCIVCRRPITLRCSQVSGQHYSCHKNCSGVFTDIANVVTQEIMDRIKRTGTKPAPVLIPEAQKPTP